MKHRSRFIQRLTSILPAGGLLFFAALPLHAADIHNAASRGQLDRVQELVTADASIVQVKDDAGRTPLVHAARRNRIEVVRFLLEHGADANAADQDGTPILLTVAEAGRTEVADLLLQHGAKIEVSNAYGSTALLMAAGSGRLNVAKLLLDRGAKVDARMNLGYTPLYFAAYQPNVELIELLLAHGANPNTTVEGGATSLQAASGAGHAATVAALLKKGANADAVSDAGETALHLAAREGHAEIVRALLASAKNLDQVESNYGQTALHWASIYGRTPVVALLKDAGASLTIKDAKGRTPLDCANQYAHPEVAAILSGGTRAAKRLTSDAIQPVAAGKAAVWYSNHSGWVVRTANHLLIFDYYRGGATPPADACLQNGFVTPAELAGLNVTVFASHEHADHYDPAIFAWKDAGAKVDYVYGFKPRDTEKRPYTGPAYTYVGPQEQQDIGGMKVAGIKSLDTGGGFLVQVDGLVIFHAGDHANLNAGTREAYDKEINYLATLADHVDLAFLPVSGCPSSWQRDQVIAGFFGAMSALKVKTALPMHGMQREWDYREFATLAKSRAPDAKVLCAEFPGDMFTVE